VADFRIWGIGFYRFSGGLVLLATVFGARGNPFQSADGYKLAITVT
jgi:hypothetical protein